MAKHSLAAKIKALAPGDEMVLVTDDYQVLMRNISGLMCRGLCPQVDYAKAQIIIHNVLSFGVAMKLKDNNTITTQTKEGEKHHGSN